MSGLALVVAAALLSAEAPHEPPPELPSDRAGKLSKQAVLKTLNEHSPSIQRCYEKELIKHRGLEGKLTFAWTVTERGAVRDARLRASTMPSKAVPRCILKVIRGMTFPKPEGGTAQIVYPFMFRSSG